MDVHSKVRQEYGVCFFFNDTATTEIYTLSLHDALLISIDGKPVRGKEVILGEMEGVDMEITKLEREMEDRTSTRLNSSH